jgi:hypothetical protein
MLSQSLMGSKQIELDGNRQTSVPKARQTCDTNHESWFNTYGETGFPLFVNDKRQTFLEIDATAGVLALRSKTGLPL